MGIVVEEFPGKDGILRCVKIKTSKGMITRPVQRLHHLEISHMDSEIVAEATQEATPTSLADITPDTTSTSSLESSNDSRTCSCACQASTLH